MKLIDKEKVVAEIKKLRKRAYELYGCSQFDTAYNNVLDSIDTLEVKEVDLDREIKRYRMRNPIIQHREESLYDYMANIAKYFFELGLKTKGK